MKVSIEQIREIMNERSEQDLSNVTLEDDKSLEYYGIDSMDMINMAFDLDDLLGVQLDDSALERMQTLGHIRELLAEHNVEIV